MLFLLTEICFIYPIKMYYMPTMYQTLSNITDTLENKWIFLFLQRSFFPLSPEGVNFFLFNVSYHFASVWLNNILKYKSVFSFLYFPFFLPPPKQTRGGPWAIVFVEEAPPPNTNKDITTKPKAIEDSFICDPRKNIKIKWYASGGGESRRKWQTT